MDLFEITKQLKSKYAEDVKLVLLVDEIDQIDEYGQEVHQALRNICMDLMDELRMVTASVRIAGEEWTKLTSPWYNFFYMIKITPIEKEYAVRLIKKPVKHIYSFSDEAIEFILEYSNLEPYYIQMFCRHAIEKIAEENRKTVTREDVEYVFRNILKKDSDAFQIR